jgi:hypothetical protein
MKEKKLIAVYNITQTDYPVDLVANLDFFDNIIIDGKDKINKHNYTFDTVGEHLVEIELKGDTIGDEAFWENLELISVIISDGVTSIDEYAFYGCENLKSVTIPNSVTTIGKHAFEDCSALTTITIPDGVKKIGQGAFIGCLGLTSVTISDSVTDIDDFAFAYCFDLTDATIPNGATRARVGEDIFYKCENLKQIYINH